VAVEDLQFIPGIPAACGGEEQTAVAAILALEFGVVREQELEVELVVLERCCLSSCSPPARHP
jgi:hypothetical protein